MDLLTPPKSRRTQPICALEIKKNGNFKRVSSDASMTALTDSTATSSTCGSSNLFSVSLDNQHHEIVEVKNATAKIGTLQAFCHNVGPLENFSEDLFSADEVHKIGILDMRILNLDRNACNIMVTKVAGKYQLVPIDHGLSMPDSLAVSAFDLVWTGFPQAHEPFSARSLAYIQSVDVIKDLEMLEASLYFRPICLRNIRISTTLLQVGAANGLTLAQIAGILCRSDDDDSQPSLLEQLVAQTEESIRSARLPIKTECSAGSSWSGLTRDGDNVEVLDQLLTAPQTVDVTGSQESGRRRSQSVGTRKGQGQTEKRSRSI